MSDASKPDSEVRAIRGENAKTLMRGRGYTGPETTAARPARAIAAAAAARQRALQARRRRG
jgi:hypothetical protein